MEISPKLELYRANQDQIRDQRPRLRRNTLILGRKAEWRVINQCRRTDAVAAGDGSLALALALVSASGRASSGRRPSTMRLNVSTPPAPYACRFVTFACSANVVAPTLGSRSASCSCCAGGCTVCDWTDDCPDCKFARSPPLAFHVDMVMWMRMRPVSLMMKMCELKPECAALYNYTFKVIPYWYVHMLEFRSSFSLQVTYSCVHSVHCTDSKLYLE